MELQVAVAVWVWPVVTGIRGEKGGEWAVEGRESVFVCVCAVVGMGRRFGVGDGPHGGLAGVIVESCWSRARFESL